MGTRSAAPVKLSKKEQNKKNKEGASSEVHAFNQSNQTAAMMALGRKGNKYSWMSGGASNMPTNRFAKAGGPNSGASTPVIKQDPAAAAAATGGAGAGSGAAGDANRVLSWGDWREDGVDGKGIQLRDWTAVLERDGRTKKALQKAVTKLE